MKIALLTAAGSGTRMHLDIPKQFVHVNNKPIIVHTMERFQEHPQIDAIIVVTIPTWVDFVWAYAKQFNITKLKWVVPGGATGQESIMNGLSELKPHCSPDDVVMIHDGNRPLVDQDVISNSIAVFNEKGGAITAIPVVEAVFVTKDGETSDKSIPREELVRTQTPHTFTLKKMLDTYEEAQKRGLVNTTAICTVLAELGETVHFSIGNEKNLKITTMADLELFEAFSSMGNKSNTGI